MRTEQLSGTQPYKVRLSAVVWLGKKSDARAIAALSDALTHDAEHTIRRVAARSLGSLVTARTPASVRERALSALQRAADGDANARVRRGARRSLKKLAALSAPERAVMPAPGARANVLINVGQALMNKKPAPGGMDRDVQSAVGDVLRRAAPSYAIAGNPRGLPTRAELAQSNTRGWFVGATIAQLDVRRNGGTAEVRCTVSMRVNPWDGRDAMERMIAHDSASASGNGRVTGANTARGIDSAKRDCVTAVAEQVTARQVVPFLKQRNP